MAEYPLQELKFRAEQAGKAACVRAWAGDEKWARRFAIEAATWARILLRELWRDDDQV